MDQQQEFLQYLYTTASTKHNLSSDKQQRRLYRLTDQLLDCRNSARRALANKPQAPAEFRLASLLLDSRIAVNSLSRPVTVAIVFSMRSDHQHPQPHHGNVLCDDTNTLTAKLNQLSWIFDHSEVDWRLYAIDDGSAHHCREIAVQTGKTHPHGDRLSVARPEQQLPAFSSAQRGLKRTDQSSNADALTYGCERALADQADVVVVTNADNQVHLGQIGLSLQLFTHGYDVIVGNQQETTDAPSTRLLRHMQYMIGREVFGNGIRNFGFPISVYSRSALHHIFQQPLTFDHSFDTDWLAAGLSSGFHVTTQAFTGTTLNQGTQPVTQEQASHWFCRLKHLVARGRTHNRAVNADICAVIDRQINHVSDIEALMAYVPTQLEDAADTELGKPDLMPPAEIEHWILQCKQFSRQQQAA